MATLQLFNALPADLFAAKHNAASHVFKAAFFPSGTAMSAADSTPAYADYSGELTGGQIPSGGITLDGVNANNSRLDFDDEVIAADAANPSTVRKVLIYNDSDPGKAAIGFADYGSDQDLTPGGTLQPSASGVLQTAIS